MPKPFRFYPYEAFIKLASITPNRHDDRKQTDDAKHNYSSVIYDTDLMDYDKTNNLLYKDINIRGTDQILDMALEIKFPEPLDHPSDFFEIISDIILNVSGMNMIQVPGPLLKTLIKLKFPMAVESMIPSQILRIPLPLDLDQPAIDDNNLTIFSNWCSHILAGLHTDFRLEIRLKPPQEWPETLAKLKDWQLNLMRHRFHQYLIDKIKPYSICLPFTEIHLTIKHAIYWKYEPRRFNNLTKPLYFKINTFEQNRFKLTAGASHGKLSSGFGGFDKTLHSIVVVIKPYIGQKYHFNDLDLIIITCDNHRIYRLTPTVSWMTLSKYAPHYLKHDLVEPSYLLLMPDEHTNLHRLDTLRFDLKSRSKVSGDVYVFFNEIATHRIGHGIFW